MQRIIFFLNVYRVFCKGKLINRKGRIYTNFWLILLDWNKNWLANHRVLVQNYLLLRMLKYFVQKVRLCYLFAKCVIWYSAIKIFISLIHTYIFVSFALRYIMLGSFLWLGINAFMSNIHHDIWFSYIYLYNKVIVREKNGVKQVSVVSLQIY